jgi:hypothetical protein
LPKLVAEEIQRSCSLLSGNALAPKHEEEQSSYRGGGGLDNIEADLIASCFEQFPEAQM